MSVNSDGIDQSQAALSNASEQVAAARRRARQALAGDTSFSSVDNWRHALLSARDSVILIVIAYYAMLGAGQVTPSPAALMGIAFAAALTFGVGTGYATYSRVRGFMNELDREREEIKNNFEGERAEVYALYAAKGFTEPVLTQIVHTIAGDEDRLLKVMMEEELGLKMQHMNHPLLVGAWNFVAALAPGVLLIATLMIAGSDSRAVWVSCSATLILAIISWLTARVGGRSCVDVFFVALMTAFVCAASAFWIAQWMTGAEPGP